ncbi:MAG: hypothetical protein A3G03_02965 [Candidatus Taylorbacteria bacterium RIFCSPLOWO2_12_FULL_44_15c]|uniref:Uncharacterized protein n=1 Tax=Candidatus Taylorbacteria bacterium RIFCSPLOWO2_12_FULL_44_15c TaxID=1802333 RepID=A0A1G2P7G5_9BACT|nr:MAG: hypothetical protein A3I97_00390 [Candidatus Taylorbacteria bacterium RIFCSPLOWO2_02_FULL_44_35]OHA44268.1 MAG: hypothetical protein A3G03_02965 [Candidatus Taylorbacteria bacterium RIFCSPLOWO2_12_FULL_44_15c]
MILPGRFFDAGNHAFVGVFSETNSAQAKIPHKAVFAAATETAPDNPATEFGLFERSGYD